MLSELRTQINVLPVIGTQFVQPPPSRHRSKRLWKKLRRRTAEPLYGKPMVMSLPSRVLAKIRAQAGG